jgi:hypothetical protein
MVFGMDVWSDSVRRTVVEEIEAAVDPDAAVQQLRRGVALDLPLQFWVHIDKDRDDLDLGFLVRGKKTQWNQHWKMRRRCRPKQDSWQVGIKALIMITEQMKMEG